MLYLLWKGISFTVQKLGKRDLFSPTIGKHTQSHARAASFQEQGEVEKVMVMLTPHQVHALDKICLEIRQTSGIKLKRSMLIRSLIDGFLNSRIRYDDAKTATDLHQRILHWFRQH